MDTGHFDVHHDEPNGLHRDATQASDEQDGSPDLLQQIVQGHNVHSSPLGIGRSDEIELSPIVQETGSQLIINKCLTQILRAYEPVENIHVQIRGPLHLGGFA